MDHFPRPIDSTLHGVTDYTAGALLMTALPRMFGIEGTRSGRQLRTAGALHSGYSSVTDYPLGAAKLIPYQAHLALDAVGALTLIAAPFVTGQHRQGRKHWMPHVALGLFELGALALTDPTGRGDYHGDVQKVRAANKEDPDTKIYSGGPAVEPASARQVAEGKPG